MDQTAQLPPGVVPEGITFGHQVLAVPSLFGGLFTHAGGVGSETEKTRQYACIARGDLIGTLYIHRPKSTLPILSSLLGTDSYTAPILSPVSGLILHSPYEHDKTVEFDDTPPTSAFAILLPDDEPDPIPGEVMFSKAADLIRRNMAVLQRPSIRWSMLAKDPKEVEATLRRQLAANPRAYPAMPHWKACLDDARTRYPSLRPHLKHLAQ